MVKGVQFLVDEPGKKTAVLIDLRKNAELWEDFYDRALATSTEWNSDGFAFTLRFYTSPTRKRGRAAHLALAGASG